MRPPYGSLEARLEKSPVPIAIVLPDGDRIGPADASLRLTLHDPAAVAALATGAIGTVGAEIVEGRVRFEGSVRELMLAAQALLQADPVHDEHTTWWRQALVWYVSRARHTTARDAENIQFHYDVSDDFYALWLDPWRVYSCAYYRTPDMALAQAQEAKLDHICRKLRLQPGERFLDVGSGWGGMLLWAAEHYGVQGTGITLSRNQYAYVQKCIEERGLGGRVQVLLQDYRELQVSEPFDKISSIGMFEHVGRAQMPTYFSTLQRLLKPGGLAMNHGITAGGVDNTGLGAGLGEFIDRYIFPGGELLHVSVALQEIARAGLEMVDTENIRPHYARTLWAWSDALEAQLPRAREILVAQHGEDRGDKVLRAYRLYLAGCALGFEQGWVALHQILMTRPDGLPDSGPMAGAQSEYPFNREYIYTPPQAGATPRRQP
ncbi:class I SAM-dependent methyltransferase [Comamonas flocculans]|uniref:Methyltransferase domain-containing protein n=1 Tax=Comamonas flocculans TaxID=2597701 RepID=A0A5B8RRF2_9BURK|nr:class I SAM-dependent methyltransferase [Comamonas flocculans]QEA12136.1 methyltransferase domain-containing protein [Comamonas flocculans]